MKVTRGPYQLHKPYSTIYLEGRASDSNWLQEIAAFGVTEGYDETSGNAELCLQAFEVFHKSGKTPKELLEQNQVLVEALRYCEEVFMTYEINRIDHEEIQEYVLKVIRTAFKGNL